MILSLDDLRQISGRSRPSAIVRWLRSRGWPHELNAKGHPVVSRQVAEAKLAGLRAVVVPQRVRPNLEAVKR